MQILSPAEKKKMTLLHDPKCGDGDGRKFVIRFNLLLAVLLYYFGLAESLLVTSSSTKMIKQQLGAREDVVIFPALALKASANGIPQELQLPNRYLSSFLSQYKSRNPEAAQAAAAYAANLRNSIRPKMIVFDKDGTLGDCTSSLRRWVMHMGGKVRSVVKKESEKEAESIIQELYDRLGWDVERDDVVPSAPVAAGTWDDIVSIVFDFLASQQSRLNRAVSLNLVQQWHHEMGALHGHDAPVLDDLKSMMMTCRDMGYLVAVCTSDDRPATDAAMKAWDIDGVVNVSICGNEVACGKPSPVPMYELCSKANRCLTEKGLDVSSIEILPQDCIMVGDTTADTGMAKAANVGFCVGVLTGSGTIEQLLGTGAHMVVPDVGHIPALLNVLQDTELYEWHALQQ